MLALSQPMFLTENYIIPRAIRFRGIVVRLLPQEISPKDDCTCIAYANSDPVYLPFKLMHDFLIG
jgi:hypothetical protein